MIIGIGNIGSTSLKTKIIDVDDANGTTLLGEANIDRVKTPGDSTFAHRVADGPKETEIISLQGYKSAIQRVLDWYVRAGVVERFADIQAMGFKCVMGLTNGANNLTPAILDEMRRFSFCAPVHNLPYLEAIDEFRQVLDVPMVGVFEPSFHHTIPEFRRYAGLPWEWHQRGIKKYGFHGASHRYLAAAAARRLGRMPEKLVTAHLGGSSSMCAIRDGRSVDIDQYFSPNSGLMQGTRTGYVDGTTILFAMKEFGLGIDEAQDAISNHGGLKSMAGLGTEDARTIEEAAVAGNHRALMTLDLYIDGIRKDLAGFAAVLGGLDVLVFSGGIGENSPSMRRRIAGEMSFMGLEIDDARNDACRGKEAEISADNSRVKILVLPTNEELVVACLTKRVVELGRDLLPEETVFSL